MFEIGDRVRVKEDAKSIPDGINFVPEMNCYRGNVYEIKHVNVGLRENAYHLVGCDYGYGDWAFDESWLEYADNKNFDVDESDVLLCFR